MQIEKVSSGTDFSSDFVNEETLQEVAKAVEQEGAQLGVGGGGLHFDTRRFALTVGYIREFNIHSGYCVEIGSLNYLSSKVIWSFFPHATVTGTSNDLRKRPLQFADNSVDNILCTEVIEHISDINYKQATTLDGIFFFLDEVYRVLRVGGRALITTPNAASLWAIQQALSHKAPLMYDWHFREFTKSEMKKIIEYSGFKIVAHNTEFSWHLWNFKHIEDFMKTHNYASSDRGDDQFIIIEKTSERVRTPHHLALPCKKEWKEEGWQLIANNILRMSYNMRLRLKLKMGLR
ncbi:methyltransferase domain-containing protein [Pseudomonas multiresinivorans]|uniref:Class I SAM-dependent methyltransferase n=1 Tax=Pseudomonas multiresinivorans TaxID=95301 RepID=A0A7Z3GQ28_9PSED|nr:methyltransferase domain-containing protein [Pseudomonas multiresinivorans]QJP08284.1 class I SAM-dependent methyltransferase [Pseudomonas multiresinivorans]